MKFGAWILKLMPILAQFKWLRGQWFDPLAKNPERVAERQLIEDYMQLVNEVVNDLTAANQQQALEILNLVNTVRGFTSQNASFRELPTATPPPITALSTKNTFNSFDYSSLTVLTHHPSALTAWVVLSFEQPQYLSLFPMI